MNPSSQPGPRIAYIDWLRGLACLVMFQGHCYDAWLASQARDSGVYGWSQLLATLPAPLFLFLSGFSLALVTERQRKQGTPRGVIAKTAIRRGAEILAFGLLFRLQEFLLGYPRSPWTDLFRVDVLNTIGVSIMVMGVVWWMVAMREQSSFHIENAHRNEAESLARFPRSAIQTAIFVAAIIALFTPPLLATRWPSWVPWQLASYVNGVHNLNRPQHGLFPIFPWLAFAFVGFATGLFLLSGTVKGREARSIFLVGAMGIAACAVSMLCAIAPVHLYRNYDYWHNSPEFFLMRCGILLVLLSLVYAWCRWGFAQNGFSPVLQLGKTSLLVYWVHIEFVYGRMSILPRAQCGKLKATAGLLVIFILMLALSLVRTWWKSKGLKVSQEVPRPAAAPAAAES